MTNRKWWLCALVLLGGCGGALEPCGNGTIDANGICVSVVGCGPGTRPGVSQCEVDASSLVHCGAGTHETGTECLPDQPNIVDCGPGTYAVAGVCVLVPPLSCGAGTHIANGQCVSDSAPLVCGAGTTDVNGSCVPSATQSCGAGTHALNDVCLPDVNCGVGTVAVGSSCVPDPSTQLVCGAGTHLSGSQCLADSVPQLTCGPGTHASGTVCLPDTVDPGLSCGAGTHADGGQCLPDVPVISCGAGTHVDGGACLPDNTTSCGAGTHASGSVCLPDDSCGAGTHDQNGSCVPNPRYQVRVATTHIPADGLTKIPVVVFGDNVDGTPATGTLVLTIAGVAGGTLAPASVTLTTTATDATTYLVGCNGATTPACLGTFTIRAALAGAPATIVAESQPLTAALPSGVASAAACAGDLDVLFFDGDSSDYIHPGAAFIDQGAWKVTATGTPATGITLQINPTTGDEGGPTTDWSILISSAQLGQPLGVQEYDNVQRSEFAAPGHAGLDIYGDGRGCNQVGGRFQIEQLQTSGATVTGLTMSFEQHCENGTAALRGCLHFQQ